MATEMDGKYETNKAEVPPPYINPFVHKIVLDTPAKLKVYLLTVLLLPIRIICISIVLVLAWLLACIGLSGLSQDDLQAKPLVGWRKNLKIVAALSMRVLFIFGSFNWIKYKGVQASSKEAPILCVAPHSSVFDAILVIALGPPSIVAKAETAFIPFFGKLINYTQPIYVWREDPNSRQNTIKEIVKRANSEEEWPQVLIFPEGTCTNRRALITFKPGAFYPGVPVQPVCIRYPDVIDSYTWTWEGPGVCELIWLTLTKLHSGCEIEFLPVYTPNQEEKTNARLYARNVRDVMAKHLNLPTSDFSYDDCIIMSKAKDMDIPHAADIVEVQKIRKSLNLDEMYFEKDLILNKVYGEETYLPKISELSQLLNIPSSNEQLNLLFSIFYEPQGFDLMSYLLCALFLMKKDNEPAIDFLSIASKLYSDSNGHMSKISFRKLLNHSGMVSSNHSNSLTETLFLNKRTSITFEEFAQYVKNTPEYKYLTLSCEIPPIKPKKD